MQSKIMQSDNSRQYFQRSSRQNLPKRQASILCDQTPSLFHYTAKTLRCQVFDLRFNLSHIIDKSTLVNQKK